MKKAFTLVELLVVVTIIVVLLSLLLPAMGKAIYQANLAVCGTRQRTVAAAVTDYATNSRRFYPDRGLHNFPPKPTGGAELGPMALYQPPINYDVRRTLKGFVPINTMLQCPLVEPVDLEIPPETNPDTFLECSYMLFWGWLYKPSPTESTGGMFKIGDRWESPRDSLSPASSYGLLMGDIDLRYGNSLAEGSHPDKSPQKMIPIIWVNFSAFGRLWNLSRWSTPLGSNVVRRNTIDDNFAYDDLSVRRINDVKGWGYIGEAIQDDRMSAPWLQFDGGEVPGQDRMYVPKN
jgi:prepilin-type N-terminal cleavage/methylation domain-containing protein